jgi:linoleate 10R-lipoxygenase
LPSTNEKKVSAARDPKVFPNPDEVRLDRPLESYLYYDEGPHTSLGGDASRVALTAMLRVVGRLDNLRRAPGPQGALKKIPHPGGSYVYMKEDHSGYVVYPTSMYPPFPHVLMFMNNITNYSTAFKVHFDGELPRQSK